MSNISWDEYFMGIAELSAKRSKDPKTKVGACIVGKDKRILSIGYNGLPYGMPDDVYADVWNSDLKHKYVVHAEANAILNSEANLAGATLYVTMFPCNECAKLIAQKRLAKVIYKDDKFRNKDCAKYTLTIFREAEIECVKYKEENTDNE